MHKKNAASKGRLFCEYLNLLDGSPWQRGPGCVNPEMGRTSRRVNGRSESIGGVSGRVADRARRSNVKRARSSGRLNYCGIHGQEHP
jgi:hypothetical protein